MLKQTYSDWIDYKGNCYLKEGGGEKEKTNKQVGKE